jgi:hypothetical protein
MDMQNVHCLHEYVESGTRTVKQVLDHYGNADWVVEQIGYRVNLGTWSIAGASPNGGGFGAKKGESDKTKLNRLLGAEIATKCAESTIEVRERFKKRV